MEKKQFILIYGLFVSPEEFREVLEQLGENLPVPLSDIVKVSSAHGTTPSGRKNLIYLFDYFPDYSSADIFIRQVSKTFSLIVLIDRYQSKGYICKGDNTKEIENFYLPNLFNFYYSLEEENPGTLQSIGDIRPTYNSPFKQIPNNKPFYN